MLDSSIATQKLKGDILLNNSKLSCQGSGHRFPVLVTDIIHVTSFSDGYPTYSAPDPFSVTARIFKHKSMEDSSVLLAGFQSVSVSHGVRLDGRSGLRWAFQRLIDHSDAAHQRRCAQQPSAAPSDMPRSRPGEAPSACARPVADQSLNGPSDPISHAWIYA